MKPTPARAALAAVLVSVCVGALAACAEEHREIRTRCDGPNMVYEAWRIAADDDDPQLELRQVKVVPNDPRCATVSPSPS
ncbi:hypothetical protein I0C86_16575 [Plantactinospora sp. S1510]|uniref:Lipoprotein n=1 Tax=Plantactinospora alkalitolerans TaxID=2789879 RepID=A0ABS0GWH2_9ACTN|nr:hypothetical protein [Plantactinospora alkalitolerans]MBF9130565.1 hypothetical protein [Plantactinospora alkalitolerans]